MPTGQRKIRVLIADNHPIVQEGMKALLGSESDMEIFQLERDLPPDVVVFDFALAVSVFDIVKKYPNSRIVVFTDYLSEEHVYQAIQAGARGYLDKKAPLETILNCIRTVDQGQTWIPRQVAELLARRMATPQLTRREQEVLFEMAQGKSNRQIGAALGLSEGTVKVHMTHILGKLGVGGRLEALATASSRGLIQPPILRVHVDSAA